MTRIQSALTTLLLIRHEKTPPLIRYTLLLALAEKHPQPLTALELCEATRDDIPQNGTLDTMVESGLITRHHDGKKARTYTLTPAGEAEAARIVLGKHKPRPAPQPDMTRVAAALQ